jgi:tetratricopeptide (TPR) repeat protein
VTVSSRSAFHAGLAYWEQRDAIGAASAQLRRLAAAVHGENDLALYQWGQLFAATLDFAPTLIVELGRHRGNSTCVFTTAAQALDARVVSLCLSERWRTETRPRITNLVPPSWLSHLDAREEDIAAADFEGLVGDAPRVLILWDAHGYHIAEHVLGRLLPAVAARPHLVLAHDISDVRYEAPPARPVGERYGLWRGNDWSGPRVRLGHLDSCVEQAVAMVDFTSRNGVTLHTAAEDIHGAIGAHAFRIEVMERTLGDLWAAQAHWCHFSLNERRGPYRYPAAARTQGPAVPAAAPTPRVSAASAAPGRVGRPQHAQSLEIVVTGRADDHGGPEFFERLVAAAAHNHALLDRAGISHTFTLVEWNPMAGRRPLAEAVAERLPFWGRAYVVEPAWHDAISTNPRLQFMEFFAKNVAVRRSTADAILTTNSDVFLSEALVARLAAAPLEDEHVYRAVRYDVDRHCDWRRGGEPVLAEPRHHLRINQLAAPEFSNAAGDFLLLTAATWRRLRGFNETVRFAKIHKDGQFCHRAWIEGLIFDTLGPIWHLDHDGSYSNVGVLHGAPDAPYGPEWNWRDDYRNADDWGLATAVEESAGGPVVWLRHPPARAGTGAAAGESGSSAIDAPALGQALLDALAVAPAALDAWLAGLGLPEGARLAIGGPDWATPWLAASARAAGHPVVGLYTADARVVGTVRCGYVARPLTAVDDAAIDACISGLSDPAVEARLRRAGFTGPVRGVLPAPLDALAPNLPAELAMLLDVQRASAADPGSAGDDLDRTVRFAALATLAGPGRFAHAYDAALAWEKRGRLDEAARALAHVVEAVDADAALQARARFHLGRLHYERGEHAAARQHLTAVLEATPDHRRARGYLDAIARAGGAGA